MEHCPTQLSEFYHQLRPFPDYFNEIYWAQQTICQQMIIRNLVPKIACCRVNSRVGSDNFPVTIIEQLLPLPVLIAPWERVS